MANLKHTPDSDECIQGSSDASPCMGGLRMKGLVKNSNNIKPLITIITSTYNAADQLPRTISSIRAQEYQQVEWIVIDGASRDGTLELLKENQDVIDYWLSEPDSGIYEAWNKALPLVKGDWVLFLGAGDTLADVKVLEDISPILAQAKGKHSIVYGKVALISPGDNRLLSVIGEPWEFLKDHWEYGRPKLPYHQGVFHDSSLFRAGMNYDASYRIAADGKLLLAVLKKEDKFLFRNRMIATMVQDGVSSDPNNMMACYREFIKSCQETGFAVPVLHRFEVLLKIVIRGLLYKFMPLKWYEVAVRFVRSTVLKRSDYPE